MSGSNPKTILVFTASYGNGHNRASEAIAIAIQRINPDIQVKIIDFLAEAYPRLNSFAQTLYLRSIKSTPMLYGQWYKQTDFLSSYTELNRRAHLFLGREKLLEILDTHQADAAICTFPFPAGLLSELKGMGKLHIPTATVITDYVLHRQWIQPNTDYYFVATDWLKESLIRRGVAPEKIHVTGIPVHEQYSVPYDQQQMRKKYDLEPDKPTVLVMGGAYGNLPGIKKICRYLASQTNPIQLLIICGKNQTLKRQLEEDLKQSPHPIRQFGFVHEVHELMAASDIVITKAGGLTVSESLAIGRPLIIYRPIPGQEKGNTKFLTMAGAAVSAENWQQFQDVIDKLLASPAQLEQMGAASRRLGRPNAAQDIAKMMIRSTEMQKMLQI
mgnify:CR=1 FL=1